MASNTNAPVDAAVDAPCELPKRPTFFFSAVPFNLIFGRLLSNTMTRIRRLFSTLWALVIQQRITGGSSKKPQDGAAEAENESQRGEMVNGEGDNMQASSSQQTCTGTTSSSTVDLSSIVSHANGIVIPNHKANDTVNDGGRGRGAFALEDRLLDFLRNVPGWSPDRAASPSADSYHNAGGSFNESDDEELQFSMDDLVNCDHHYAP
ncbi:hypothetical protein N0V93_003923 [Gnomoniopsis smithogilvyi]|uniref:Uncharacterized protein n=1 Tax=Gnomoniopsis smithogilvyi TaxID=1191159 RepID=A0A9W8YZC5_9PEZI|nr:hypothetical protein N0V93_003923 [Gnomoniopsis smithogilvyi]